MNKTQEREKTKMLTVLHLQGASRAVGKEMPLMEAVGLANELHRFDRALHRLAEEECNGWPKSVREMRGGKLYIYNVEDVERGEFCQRKEARIRTTVQNMMAQIGVVVEFGGDPRGAVMRLHFKDGARNGWGDGWILDW